MITASECQSGLFNRMKKQVKNKTVNSVEAAAEKEAGLNVGEGPAIR